MTSKHWRRSPVNGTLNSTDARAHGKARKTPSHPHCCGELMARTFDAIVVGARVNVLVAAAELARIR